MISDRARAIVDYFSNVCSGCAHGQDCRGNDAACADRETQERYVQAQLDEWRNDVFRLPPLVVRFPREVDMPRCCCESPHFGACVEEW